MVVRAVSCGLYVPLLVVLFSCVKYLTGAWYTLDFLLASFGIGIDRVDDLAGAWYDVGGLFLTVVDSAYGTCGLRGLCILLPGVFFLEIDVGMCYTGCFTSV